MAFIIAGIAKQSIFRLNEHERLVVYRLGKAIDVHGPGLIVLIPFIQSGIRFDITDPLDARLIHSYQQQVRRSA